MSIKKSLLALVAAAIATMALASSAMATDGVLRDHVGTEPIKENTVLHLVGWTKFTTANGSFECHRTWNIKAVGNAGSTGEVTAFTIPDTTKCTNSGAYAGCKVKTHETKNLPYHVTVTDNGRIDITGKIQIYSEYSNCLMKSTLLTFEEIQLTPKKTGTTVPAPTGTENKLGATAALNETIAGFEIGGLTAGPIHIVNIFGGESTENITGLTGEFELTSPQRCTYEITAT